MDFQRLTVKSQEAIAAAQELARRRGNPEIVPTHLLLALLDQELPQTLLGEQAAEVRAGAEADLARLPSLQGAAQQPGASTAFSRVLDRAEEEMRKLEDEFVSLVVVLALMTAAFAVSGYWGAAVILVLAIAAEAVHLVRRKRRAT